MKAFAIKIYLVKIIRIPEISFEKMRRYHGPVQYPKPSYQDAVDRAWAHAGFKLAIIDLARGNFGQV